MVNGLDPASKQFLASLGAINQRLERAQRQVASGKRILSASDDPDQVGPLLQVRVDLRQTEQLAQNLSRVQGEVDAGEQALQQALRLVERAQVLGAQGGNGTQTAATRASIADEVKSLLDQLVGLSQTSIDGRYIFSGESDQSAPYTLDWSLDTPLSFYQGSAATRKTVHPSGTEFSIAHAGDVIFDNPDTTKNVFAAVNNLRQALVANDETAILASVGQLRTAGDHLNTELGYYGSIQNQVADAVDSTQKAELRLKTRLSAMEDADLTESILELNQARYQQEVALSSRAQLPRTSLFDYLG
jgi:flagellar hook-associated protein 3 FlgL